MTNSHSPVLLQPPSMGNTLPTSVKFNPTDLEPKTRKGRDLKSRVKLSRSKLTISEPTLPSRESTLSSLDLQFKRRSVRLQEIRLELGDGDIDTEIETHIEKFLDGDEASKAKFHKFVTAWRSALSFPHTKMHSSSTGIPVAGTSFCRQDISRWKRYGRHCLQCTSGNESEKLLADLLHKESLERFLKNTEVIMMGTSSIVIKEDLKRKRLDTISLHESDIELKQTDYNKDKEGNFDENNLTLTVHLNLPPPVHIEHPPKIEHKAVPNEELVKHSWERENKTIPERELKKKDLRHGSSASLASLR